MEPGIFTLGPGGWAFAAVCGIVIGMSKCGIAGLGTLAVLFMAMVLPARISTGALLPLLIFGDAIGILRFHRHADWKLLVKLLPSSVLGVALGFWLMGQPFLNDMVIRKSIGGIVLVLCVLTFFQGKVKALADKEGGALNVGVAIFVGILAGATTMIANAAGPVTMIYLLLMRLPKNDFIGTSAWFYIIVNWLKVPFMVKLGLINAESLMFDLKLTPAVILGCALGIFITNRLSEKKYKLWLQLLTIVAALKLLF